MKTFLRLLCGCLFLAAARTSWGLPATNSAAAFVPIRSVFIVPASPKDGRDPFYPESQRLFKTGATSQAAPAAVLVIRGYSGDGSSLLVIINNHTFGAGDEGDVTTPGGRVHVRCLEINPGSAVVEVNGQKRELKF